ncbi:MAG: DUF790 family protein [Thermoplasmatales archaeon]
MFPVQLMSVRKSNKGVLRSIFLTEDNSDYCSAVLDLFNRNVGKTRGEIEESLKTMELKVQNPKILRGIALIMFRYSEFRKPSSLDAERVRKIVFSLALNPSISPSERKRILEKAASILVTDVAEVESALYGDMESNQILVSPKNTSPEILAKIFNREQIETVMMKSLWVEVLTEKHFNEFIRSVRSKGLLYSESMDGNRHKIRVDGPVSIFEKSERYGVKLSLFIRDVLTHDDWEINAKVSLKERRTKKEFNYHLDDSISGIIDLGVEQQKKIPDFVNTNPNTVKINSTSITPDYSINLGGDVFIFITTTRQYANDISKERMIRDSGLKAETFCVLENGEKCPKGAICFKEEIDWWRVKEYLDQKYRAYEKRVNIEETKSNQANVGLSEKIVSHLNALYPDGQAMIEYLEFMGMPPEESLKKAGFIVMWKGLKLVVTGRTGSKIC